MELKVLDSFGGTNGASPLGGLTLGKDGNFYGTTQFGGTKDGSAGFGTVFRVTPDGVLTSLVSFNGENGYNPQAPLTSGDDGNLYGTTANGGTNGGNGTVFKMTTNGVLTSLASFQYLNGLLPRTGVTMAGDGNLYGTTYGGGNAMDLQNRIPVDDQWSAHHIVIIQFRQRSGSQRFDSLG